MRCSPEACSATDWPSIRPRPRSAPDRKSTRLNSSHVSISYAVFCLKKKIIHEPPAILPHVPFPRGRLGEGTAPELVALASAVAPRQGPPTAAGTPTNIPDSTLSGHL